jgi:hypothetical protein
MGIVKKMRKWKVRKEESVGFPVNKKLIIIHN